jgi:hypothetical protein
MTFLFRGVLLLFVTSLAVPGSEEMGPDFGKLVPVALFPAAMESARTNKIPVEGFDPQGEAGSLNPGDSITALIILFEKRGQKSQWLLYVEAAEPTSAERERKPKEPAVLYVGAGAKMEFTGSLAPVTLRLLGPFVDGTGKRSKVEDQQERIMLDKGFLAIGLDDAAAAFHRIEKNKLHGKLQIRPRPFTESEVSEGKREMAALQLSAEEQRAIAGSQLALMSYVHLVQETPGLDDLFYKVVKLPSVWSVVRHLGVTVSLDLDREHVAPTPGTNWNLKPGTRCFTFPLALRINKQPALMSTLVVAPARPPLLECGGIIGLLAEKPNDPKTYLLLRIISARKGKLDNSKDEQERLKE